MNFFLPDMIIKGGWLMYPILLCSIIALGVFLERLYKLRHQCVLPPDLIRDINDLIMRRRYPATESRTHPHGDECRRQTPNVERVRWPLPGRV